MISLKPVGSIYISQTRSEYGLAGFLLAIPIIIVIACLQAENTASLFVLGVLFPVFFICVSAYFYFAECILYYDTTSKRIHLRKLLHKLPFESFNLSELKNPELTKHFATYSLSFISSTSGKKHVIIIRKETKELVASWIEWNQNNRPTNNKSES